MTAKFLRRWLKLKFHHFHVHFLAVLFVVSSTAIALGLTAFLPSRPPTTDNRPPTTNHRQPNTSPPPTISAHHALVMDTATHEILYSKNADTPTAPASTTKLMTALVASNYYPPDVEITTTRSYSQGQDIGLSPGERLTAQQLLYALLIQSGNDAAEVLAENFAGGRPAFIAAMNSLAQQLRLHHTVFKNPTGLDEDGHVSTPVDLARLAEAVLKKPLLSRIVSSETALLSSTTHPRVLTNTNQLLGRVPGVLGIKTGFTDAAGEALITLVDRDGKRLLFIVLKSQDRFSDTESLINWAYPTN